MSDFWFATNMVIAMLLGFWYLVLTAAAIEKCKFGGWIRILPFWPLMPVCFNEDAADTLRRGRWAMAVFALALFASFLTT